MTRSEINRRYYQRHLEKERKRGRERYRKTIGTLEGCAKNLLRGAKQRAKKKTIPFDLTLSWIREKLSSKKCEVTSLPFCFDGGKHPFGPTIERVIPEKGYTRENCKLVIWAYNAAKGCGTHDHVLTMARALVDQ